MLRVTATSVLLAALALPAWADREVRTPEEISRAPVAGPMAQYIGGGADTAADQIIDNGLSGAESQRGDNIADNTGRRGTRQNHPSDHTNASDDCGRLVLAMDHLIALLHEHDGPFPSLDDPISELNDAEVLLGGMIAVKNLCDTRWTETSGRTANTRQRGVMDNNHRENDI